MRRVEKTARSEPAKWLVDTRPSRAFSRNRNVGIPSVSGVRPGRFDHQVEFIGAVDVTRHIGPPDQAEMGRVDDVAQIINALSVAVPDQERRAPAILRPRELDQLAQSR